MLLIKDTKVKLVAIIDYGMGNLKSVEKMVLKLGYEALITNNHTMISDADFIILPGVGHYDNAVKKLKSLGLFNLLIKIATTSHKPILGICLGMQLLGIKSDEGNELGLGLIKYQSLSFNNLKINNLIVPNMGWKDISITKNHLMTNNLPYETRFYFAHSFYIPLSNDYSLLSSTHGTKFSAMVYNKNIFGVQFHPEKSHSFGMKILDNFFRLTND